MPGKKTGQRYFVAEQRSSEAGKVLLELLEECKDATSCVSMIRSEGFAKAYPGDHAFRVAIIRAEPALRLVRKPNELAAAIGKAQGVSEVLAILAARGIAVTDGVEFTEAEDIPGGVPEEEKAPEETVEVVTAAPTAPALPDIRTLPLEQLLEMAKSINPSADGRWSKAACLTTISKHQGSGGMFIPGPDMVTPSLEGSWSNVVCPHCRTQTWMNTGTGERFNQTAGYPAHSCAGYDAEMKAAKAPPTPPPAPAVTAPPPAVVVPPAPPVPTPPVAPPVAPAPLIPPGADGTFQPGLVQPPNRSGQAPPKGPPKPPMPPGYGSGFGVH